MKSNNPGEDHPLGEVAQALARCSSPQEIREFLLCWFTPREVKDMDNRWRLVQELLAGQSQRKIAQDLGVSLCKITRGSRELKKKDSAFKKMLDLSSGTAP